MLAPMMILSALNANCFDSLGKGDDAPLIAGILEQQHALRRSLEQLQIEHLQANRVAEAVDIWHQRQQLKRSGRQLRSGATTSASNEPEAGLSQLRQIRENKEIQFLEVEGALDGHVWEQVPTGMIPTSRLQLSTVAT